MNDILIINTGSKTIKFKVFDQKLNDLLFGTIDDENGVKFLRMGADSTPLSESETPFSKIKELCSKFDISKIGFRIVHGGETYINPTKLTAEVLTDLERFNDFAPLHNPMALKVISEFRKVYPSVDFYGIFDTSFHQTIKPEQFLYGLPYEYYEKYQVRRYGFHGISHKYVSQKFSELEPGANRVISCHLGSGSSVTAIVDGKSFDTSMGFTPLEGLIMTTRPGDVDDGALLYIQQAEHLTDAEIADIENNKSGLLGISGISFDMRTLLDEAGKGNSRANLAVDMFVYRAKKYIGSYIAAMGGVDGLIFTAGIGAGSDVIRSRIIAGLDFAGLKISPDLNDGKIDVATPLKISSTDSKPIWVIPTDEEYQIAKEINNL
jgi:acetate kinase